MRRINEHNKKILNSNNNLNKYLRAENLLKLDGVRFIAALAVFLWHFKLAFLNNSSKLNNIAIDILWSGGVGVDVLFVLSGFLIFLTLDNLYSRSHTGKLRIFYLK